MALHAESPRLTVRRRRIDGEDGILFVVARRPDHAPMEVLSEAEVSELRRRLAAMKEHEIKSFYRSAHFRCELHACPPLDQSKNSFKRGRSCENGDGWDNALARLCGCRPPRPGCPPSPKNVGEGGHPVWRRV